MKNHKAKTLVIVAALILGVEIGTIPFFSVARLKSENPSETALMRQRIREAEGEGKKMNIVHTWISISRIPQHVINAVVVAEDGTFFSHGGIDWFEVQESVEKNISEGRAARGASTITQQVAKNLYLSTSKDPIRKLKEVIITLLLEQQLSKNRILEVYLNVIEWGRGIFGVESAARAYFGKSASSLSLEEATRLAAVIPSPLRHRPDANSRYVLRRKNIVLRRMLARNFTEQITTQENASNSILEPHRRVDTAAIAPENTIPEDSTDTEGEEYNGL
ncbi:MAG: monofunctional biosynthetic peptidoglycan transglycosylase [Ignavibacteriae bacterium]|nr:monofunctional biosynthetic peptidoglycan transglycosylase [Ignavibacteriota bacterium]